MPGFTHVPCKISTEFLLEFHEKEMLNQGKICARFYKRKLERKVLP